MPMQRRAFGMVAALIAVAGFAVIASAAPAKPKPAPKAGPLQALEQHFRKADADFKQGDRKAAAAEIREAANLLRSEAGLAAAGAKRFLDPAAAELDKAARRIGSIDEKALRKAFARAYHALAAYEAWRATEAWGKKESAKAGAYLNAAAARLERAAAWAEPRVKRAAAAAAKEARDVSKKLLEGSKVRRDEVSKAITGLRNRIKALGRRMGKARERRAPVEQPRSA
jgi:hypothetical protein